MRQLIKSVFKMSTQTIEWFAECENGVEAQTCFREMRPDWVLLEIKLGKPNGLETAKELLKVDPRAQIILLTDYDGPEYMDCAREVGVRACVLKENIWQIPRMIDLGLTGIWRTTLPSSPSAKRPSRPGFLNPNTPFSKFFTKMMPSP